MSEKSNKIRIRQGTNPADAKQREALLGAFKGTSIPEAKPAREEVTVMRRLLNGRKTITAPHR